MMADRFFRPQAGGQYSLVLERQGPLTATSDAHGAAITTEQGTNIAFSARQLWTFAEIESGWFVIVNVSSGHALGAGSKIELQSRTDAAHQQWSLVPEEEGNNSGLILKNRGVEGELSHRLQLVIAARHTGYPRLVTITLERAGVLDVDANGWYQIELVAKHDCVTVAGGSTEPGANCHLSDPRDDNSQLWRFEVAPDDLYVLRNRKSDLVLEVDGGSNQSGANVRQGIFDGGLHQQWTIETGTQTRATGGPGHLLINRKSGMQLAASGANLIQTPKGNEFFSTVRLNLRHQDVFTPKPGSWYILNFVSSGRRVGVESASVVEDVDLRQLDTRTLPEVQWAFSEVDRGIYTLTANHSGQLLTADTVGTRPANWAVRRGQGCLDVARSRSLPIQGPRHPVAPCARRPGLVPHRRPPQRPRHGDPILFECRWDPDRTVACQYVRYATTMAIYLCQRA